MTDSVTPLHAPPPALLVGPFEEWRVLVQGRVVPNLTGHKYDDGRVALTVDRRFGADFPNEEIASQAAWLIANAMAVSAGYPSMEAENKDRPFAPKGMEIVP
jgi:hypothetical protein